MFTTCQTAQEFLQSLFDLANLSLSVNLSAQQQNCLLDITGEDSGMLVANGGELLESLEHIVNKAFARQLPQTGRIICDVNNYRLNREVELQAMAHHASEQVVRTKTPFIFANMTANERRVIHETLADNPLVLTESVGEGDARRLKVSPRH
jgi:spoIIIJ-associated protein